MSGFENRVPAGWYPDQNMADTQRYWDGNQWTEHVQPNTKPNFAPPQHRLEPPAPGVDPEQEAKLEQQRGVAIKLILFGAVVCVVLVGLGLFSLLGSSSSDEEAEAGQVGGERSEDETATEPGTEPGVDEEIDDGSVVIGEDEPGEQGTREDPLPYDTESQLRFETFGDADGSVWMTTIGPPRDITAEVLAENQFNSAPPDGVLFVGFDASMTLLRSDKEPLAPGFNFSWELFGGETNAVYQLGTIDTESFGCGVVPGEFDNFSEVFADGTVSGTVCIPLPIEDLEHPDTMVAIHFIDDTRAVFGP